MLKLQLKMSYVFFETQCRLTGLRETQERDLLECKRKWINSPDWSVLTACCICTMACRLRLKFRLTDVAAMLWYGDGAGDTVEENSSLFSLIRMR